jgi:hypothetical protein
LKHTLLLSFLFVFLMTGCARAVTLEREAYILARDHGWIELSFEDEGVPGFPRDREAKDFTLVPPYCSLRVSVNNEPFLSETIYPFGEVPPFRVDSGFRFAVPVGELTVELTYRGCHPVEGDKGTEPEVLALVTKIEKGMVTALAYRAGRLYFEGIHKNTVITLGDVYDRLQLLEDKVAAGNM